MNRPLPTVDQLRKRMATRYPYVANARPRNDGDLMQCECGYVCRRDQVPDRVAQAACTNCPVEMSCEEVRETVCPECYALDSFDLAADQAAQNDFEMENTDG